MCTGDHYRNHIIWEWGASKRNLLANESSSRQLDIGVIYRVYIWFESCYFRLRDSTPGHELFIYCKEWCKYEFLDGAYYFIIQLIFAIVWGFESLFPCNVTIRKCICCEDVVKFKLVLWVMIKNARKSSTIFHFVINLLIIWWKR